MTVQMVAGAVLIITCIIGVLLVVGAALYDIFRK